MWLVLLAIDVLIIIVIEKVLGVRQKYQQFSSKFTRYYIDFIAFIAVWTLIVMGFIAISDLNVPEALKEYLLGFLFVYSLFIVLPVKFIDEFLQKILYKS